MNQLGLVWAHLIQIEFSTCWVQVPEEKINEGKKQENCQKTGVKSVFSNPCELVWTRLNPFEPDCFYSQVECSFKKTEDAGKRSGINLEVSAAASTILNPFDLDWIFNLLSAVSKTKCEELENKKTRVKLVFPDPCELVWTRLSPCEPDCFFFFTDWLQIQEKNRG